MAIATPASPEGTLKKYFVISQNNPLILSVFLSFKKGFTLQKIKLYAYKNCQTCKKAIKFLEGKVRTETGKRVEASFFNGSPSCYLTCEDGWALEMHFFILALSHFSPSSVPKFLPTLHFTGKTCLSSLWGEALPSLNCWKGSSEWEQREKRVEIRIFSARNRKRKERLYVAGKVLHIFANFAGCLRKCIFAISRNY